VVPLVTTLALYLDRNAHDNGLGDVLSLARHNGLLVPIAAIVLLADFLLPLLASMIGGYQLAGEAETGTIKTWLMHSVSRGGVLASKWGVAMIYMGVGLILVIVGGFVSGGIAFGLHAPLLLSGQSVSVGAGLWLTLLSFLYIFAYVACLVSIALLFSTFTNSSLTAAIAALVLVFVMGTLSDFSYFNFLRPYLFTSYTDNWQGLLSRPVDWHPIWTGLLTYAIYVAGLVAAAWYRFRRKDILV